MAVRTDRRTQLITLPHLRAHSLRDYLAALGALSALTRVLGPGVQLAWTAGAIERPVLHGDELTEETIADALDADRQAWDGSPALGYNPGGNLDNLKLSSTDAQRDYLQSCELADDGGRSIHLSRALVAHRAVDGRGKGKPTDYDFTSGRQSLLRMARDLRSRLCRDDFRVALDPASPTSMLAPGPIVRYGYPAFGWELSEHQDDARSLGRQSPTPTMPVYNWLALLGLAYYPVTAAEPRKEPGMWGRALPPGWRGTWQAATVQWGTWETPLTSAQVMDAVATGWELAPITAAYDPGLTDPVDHARVRHIYQTTVSRGEYGYGRTRGAVRRHIEPRKDLHRALRDTRLRPALDQVREATEVLAAAAKWRDEAIISAHEAGESVTAIAREAGVGRPAIYRLLARQD